jgi:very-short-patch-repair endonuclease
MTPWEAKAWVLMRQWRMDGLHFRRQAPIGPFIVDFVCHRAKLVIELDGSGHAEAEQAEQDRRRDTWLETQGYEVVRLWNVALNEDLVASLDHIYQRAISRLR